MKIGINLLLGFIGCSCVLLTQQCKNMSKKQANAKAVVVEIYQPFAKFNNDTLSYLKVNFVYRKLFYLNKPAIILFRDFELPIQSVTYSTEDFPNLETIRGIHLSFESSGSEYRKLISNKVPLTLFLRLKQLIKYGDVISLSRKTKGEWTTETKDFYGKLIIEDIHILKK